MDFLLTYNLHKVKWLCSCLMFYIWKSISSLNKYIIQVGLCHYFKKPQSMPIFKMSYCSIRKIQPKKSSLISMPRDTTLFMNFKAHPCTKMKFTIRDFFSKCDQIRMKLPIWLQLLKKSLMENFIFVQWTVPFVGRYS